ncbi:MAG: hypothetical protein ACHQQQ_11590 [Bacteroidota bacterium]
MERYFLDVFKKLYRDFPEGEIIHGEGPDFQVHGSNSVTGIEITRLFQKRSNNFPPPQALESESELIVQLAHTIYKKKNLPPLNVNVAFLFQAILVKRNRRSIANELARIVSESALFANPIITIDYRNNSERIFSEKIAYIRIAKGYDDFWGTSGSGMGQSDFIDELQKEIDDKNKKRKKYLPKCNGHWLLIVADGFGPSAAFSPSEQTKSHQYCSFFERTFFLERISEKFFELRTKKN